MEPPNAARPPLPKSPPLPASPVSEDSSSLRIASLRNRIPTPAPENIASPKMHSLVQKDVHTKALITHLMNGRINSNQVFLSFSWFTDRPTLLQGVLDAFLSSSPEENLSLVDLCKLFLKEHKLCTFSEDEKYIFMLIPPLRDLLRSLESPRRNKLKPASLTKENKPTPLVPPSHSDGNVSSRDLKFIDGFCYVQGVRGKAIWKGLSRDIANDLCMQNIFYFRKLHIEDMKSAHSLFIKDVMNHLRILSWFAFYETSRMKSPNYKAAKFQFLMDIAEELLVLHDFQGCVSILSGLDLLFNELEKEIDVSYRQKFIQLKQNYLPLNYENYRDVIINLIRQNTPYIPILSALFDDLKLASLFPLVPDFFPQKVKAIASILTHVQQVRNFPFPADSRAKTDVLDEFSKFKTWVTEQERYGESIENILLLKQTPNKEVS